MRTATIEPAVDEDGEQMVSADDPIPTAPEPDGMPPRRPRAADHIYYCEESARRYVFQPKVFDFGFGHIQSHRCPSSDKPGTIMVLKEDGSVCPMVYGFDPCGSDPCWWFPETVPPPDSPAAQSMARDLVRQ